jgi:hypothetical protein
MQRLRSPDLAILPFRALSTPVSVRYSTFGPDNAGVILPLSAGRSALEDAHTEALRILTIELIERVRSSCLHLSEEELGVLAKRMATLELKYLGYASATLCERRPVRVIGPL